MSTELKHQILSGIFWQGLERFGSQLLQLFLQIILARLLLPEAFGTLALLLSCIAMIEPFIDGGFKCALIQKKDATQDDFNSVFFLGITLSLVLYSAVFWSAPWIAVFYRVPDFELMLRVLASIMVIRAVAGVNAALLTRQMRFHLQCKINWVAILISGIGGVALAYGGFGLWALIVQQILMALCVSAAQILLVRWVPSFTFHLQSLKEMFHFGSKMFLAGLLDRITGCIYPLVIGRLFTPAMLGYYNQGMVFPRTGVSAISNSISSVIFPAASVIQEDRVRLQNLMRKALLTVMFFLLPFLGVMFAGANSLVEITITSKWLACVPFLQIACIDYMFWPFHSLNLQILTAMGYSNLFLIIEILKKVLLFAVILITWRWGIIAMAWGAVAVSFISFFLNAFPLGRFLQYGPCRQLKDMSPLLLGILINGAIAWAVGMQLAYGWVSFLLTTMIVTVGFLLWCIVIRAEALRTILVEFENRIGHKIGLPEKIRRYWKIVS